MKLRLGLVALLSLAAALPWASPAKAQIEVWGNEGQVDFSEFRIANVVPEGQPLIPYFEGWYPNPDGTKTASFGYFNLNTEEIFNIPIGPDNYIEPEVYNGVQPTHFMSAPSERGRNRRHESVFAITVPGDYDGEITWTLRAQGLTIPGESSFDTDAYEMMNLESATSSPIAPNMRVGDSPLGRGCLGPEAGPVSVRVGEPLPLDVGLDLLGRERSIVTWYHHQGPGEVSFGEERFEVDGAPEAEVVLQTIAIFSEPGDYVLRVTALETLSSLVQHCCWTNGYLHVTVTP